MKLSVSATPARAALCASVAARLFLSLMLDGPTTHNGAWFSALLAGTAAMPVAFLLGRGRRPNSPRASRLTMAVFMLAVALDAAEAMRCVTRSAGFLALDDTRPLFLLLPVALATLWCVGKNGDATGYAGLDPDFPAAVGTRAADAGAPPATQVDLSAVWRRRRRDWARRHACSRRSRVSLRCAVVPGRRR